MQVPSNLIRFGEVIFQLQKELRPGTPYADIILPVEGAGPSREVRLVSWELFTKDKDILNDLLWHGRLEWHFFRLDYEGALESSFVVPIGPLSLFEGSFVDLQSQASGLETLAQVDAEEAWRNTFQTFLLGDTFFFRGRKTYLQHAVHLPPGTRSEVHLKFDEPFSLLDGRVRFRFLLHSLCTERVEVG